MLSFLTQRCGYELVSKFINILPQAQVSYKAVSYIKKHVCSFFLIPQLVYEKQEATLLFIIEHQQTFFKAKENNRFVSGAPGDEEKSLHVQAQKYFFE